MVYHGNGIIKKFDCDFEIESEFLYGSQIGRGKSFDDEKNQKFFFDSSFKKEEENKNIYYDLVTQDYTKKNLITLEINNQEINNPGKILIKDMN